MCFAQAAAIWCLAAFGGVALELVAWPCQMTWAVEIVVCRVHGLFSYSCCQIWELPVERSCQVLFGSCSLSQGLAGNLSCLFGHAAYPSCCLVNETDACVFLHQQHQVVVNQQPSKRDTHTRQRHTRVRQQQRVLTHTA